MNEKPTLLIVSSSNTKPKSLIKLLTKSTNITEDTGNNKQTHDWTIDTKYYTADINVVGINEHYERTQQFNDSVEALIVHMDSNKASGLDDLKVWQSLEDDCEPDVKLLICNYCTDQTRITKNKATEWCLKRSFELIELYPSVDKKNGDEENDEIIEEKVGVERIIEALEAHTWSNLVMKAKKSKKNEADLDDDVAEEFLTSEGLDDFTDLFSQLHMMKDSFQSMPLGQRKQCAEQMVTAFWKAIGGDEEEIVDI